MWKQNEFTNTWGEPKIPGIVKKNLVRVFVQVWLVPFEVIPLRPDKAIPAPLPMLETLSKTFNRNAVKGQQSALHLHIVQLFKEGDDTRGCGDTICPPEDEQRAARNTLRIVV